MKVVTVALRMLLIVVAGAAVSPAVAGAATINVTTEADVVRNDGSCSLREAINAANDDAQSGAAAGECAAGNGADTIAVPAGFYGIASSEPNFPGDWPANWFGDFGIESAVTIQGAGRTETTIDAEGKGSVFYVANGATAVFVDLTISGGRTEAGCDCQSSRNGADGTGAGAGESVTMFTPNTTDGGGGIFNGGITTIRDALLTDNATGQGADVRAVGTGGNGGPAGGDGGAVVGGNGGSSGDGGAVLNVGTMTIERSTLRGNWTGDAGDGSWANGGNGGSNPSGSGGRGGDAHAGDGGDAGGGGAIASLGPNSSLTVIDSRIHGNATGDGGRGGDALGGTGGDGCENCFAHGGDGGDAFAGDGGDAGDGGGILATGSATISGTTLTGNRTGGGGLAFIGTGGQGGASGQSGQGGAGGDGHGGVGGSAGDGGGIAATGTLTLNRSTIDHNRSGDGSAGGGGGPGGASGPHPGNIGDGFGGDGGAGGTGGLSASGSATVANVTIALNEGGEGGSGSGEGYDPGGEGGDGGNGGNGGANVTAATTFTHVTVSGNSGAPGGERGIGSPGNAGQEGSTGAGGVAGPAMLRNSIVSGNVAPSCTGSPADGGGNIGFPDNTCPGAHVDPRLGPLADNGGPTETLALESGSPAIDLVPSAGAGCLATDQRGVSRPQGAACDAGAFELVPAADGNGDGSGAGDGGGNGGEGGDDGNGAPPPVDSMAPVLSQVGFTRSVFTRRRGTSFHYTLSEPARVTITIARSLPPRKGRCTRVTLGIRHVVPCTRRLVVQGRFVRSSAAGVTSVLFKGRIGSKRLAPGRYRAAFVATDAAGNRSAVVKRWFRIVPR